ncbi:hypothetical protein HNQ65_003611 [Prosthecobacter vanneervenii]|uniref:Staphylococcus aureus surface protein A n=2 Tax=Prosthecobacter vanneervenii TaxID=48466 RepID=A0A7W7YDT4_9BACT|nr:hypothetical protein [Prosthecobacter vanneervenii]
MTSLRLTALFLAAMTCTSALYAANFNGIFVENFDSMGTSGTTPPSGWSVYGVFGGSSTTWTSSIPASAVAGGTLTTSLTAATTYTATSNTNGFNYATSTATSDRSLGTSPTTGAGVALQLSLTNTTGASVNSVQISYDTRAFTAATSANELPGYWLFYSLDNGTTWTNVSATNPTITTVPNTAGSYVTAPATITLGSAWASSGTLLLRWVDDNAQQTSPDQVIGLDNVTISLPVTTSSNQALLFNSNRYITMGAATATLGASNLTLECWFKRTGSGTATSTGTGGVTNAIPLVTKGRAEADGSNVDCNYFFGIDASTNKLCADFEAQAGVSGITAGQNYPIIGSTVIQNDTWYHAAVTYDTSTYTWNLYLNGVLDATFTNPTGAAPRNDSIQHFGIGTAMTSTGAAAGWFQGVIDEVRVWNIARTATQIAASKSSEITTATTGLLARYGLNEGTGTSVSNTVGTAGAPTGTLTNSPMWINGAPFNTNVAPTAALTAPATGTTATVSAGVSLTATASDTDGTVAQVEFLRDGSVVGTVTSSPYTFTDSTVTAGVHTYAARATDNGGAATTSSTVTVSVLTSATKTALLFDGVNDYVTMGVAPELNAGGPPSNGFTLECWFRKEGTGVTSSSGNGGVTGVPLFGKGRGEAENSNVDCNYFFGINTSGLLVADFEAYPATGITGGQNYPITGSNTPITNNVWHHAAATYDGNSATWTLYLDGVSVGTATAAAGALPRYDSIQHFGIGAAFTSAGVAEGAFAGRIDEVRVWNYARSASEIAGAKDYEIASATGLIGRYGLNEGTGTTTANSVGTGAPVGTMTNGPLWVDGAAFTPNILPTVSLDAPTAAYTGTAPATVHFAATASDSDGSITKVEFYNGSTKVGESTSAPFAYDWAAVAAGDYTLSARAIDNQGGTTTSATVSITVSPNPNKAPVIALTAPVDNASGLGSSTNLNVSLSDPEGDAMTVTFYGRKTTPSTPGADFSFIAVPDTQFYSENTGRNASGGSSGAVVSLFNAQTQWMVDNRSTRNIAFVSHMGDIVQNGDTYQQEWINADGAMKKIESQTNTLRAYGIPWGGAPGNHDFGTGGGTGTTTYYNQYFGTNRWAGRNYYGGNFGTTNNSNYEFFSASGLDFIVIHLEYNAGAVSSYQAMLDWADALLKAYPNRRAIVTSHWIVNTGNPATFSTQGQAIYDNLKDNPNLFLMLCGHVNGEGRRSDTYQGRTVYSILQDYQDIVDGGRAFMRIYTFSPANNQITVESYSPTLNRAVNASDSVPSWTAAYTLPYNMQSSLTDWVPLGTASVSAGGTSASLNWTGLEAGGSYEWYATVTDTINTATSTTRRFSTAANSLPAVAVTSPADGSGVALNTAITINASASDTDGTVAKVEFFDADTKLGEDTSAPYSFAWSNATAGNHTLTAVATDNSGGSTLSAPVVISVNNTPPTVALTEPDPGEIFDSPASIYMTADAADTDGTVARVEYYANGTKVGEATTSPYAFFWNNVYTGSYTLTAKAIDDGGASTTSAVRTVSVTNTDNVAPTAAITSPAGGVAYAGGITITASAADTDGTITKVEFFNGSTKLGEATTAPYSLLWSSVAVGTYTLTVTSTDNDGAATTSSPVTINVQAAPLSFSENFDSMGTSGTSPPSGWSMKNANSGTTNATWTDSIPIPGNGTNSVSAMVAASGALTANSAPSATNNNGYNAQGASSTDRVLCTSPTSVAGVAIQWQLTNTGSTTITALNIGYDTRRYTAASTANELPGYWLFYSLDNGTTWTNVSDLNPTLSGSGVQVPNTVGVTTISPAYFPLSSGWAAGATLLLRWVDDNAVATSPDQIIGLDNVTLSAAGAQIGSAPSVAVTAPLATDAFTAPATINISASASDTDGTITKVEFYNGATKLGEASTSPYGYAWSGVASGSYSLTARATDNDGNITISSAVAITVNAAPGSGTLTRAAYLQQAGPTTMTIRWRSSQSIVGRVRYGSSAASLTSIADETAAATDHEVTLTGLTPGTTYFYSIGSPYDTLAGGDAAHTFTTPPVAGTTPNTRIWVLGDAGTGTSSQTSVRDAFYTWTGSRDPNLVLELGDNAYNSGLDSEFQTKVFDIYGSLMKRVPFWSCLGNHETSQATSFVDTYPYFSVYTFPKNGECGGVASGSEHYYSFDYGNIHFITLDSMTASRSPSGAMATWLKNDLASTTRTWIICIFHHPPYTKGSHNSDTETELMEMRANILPILENGGVDLVLCGHSHCYERSYLLDGHYGLSSTLTSAMKKNAGDGRPAGNGAYIKPLTGPRDHFGAVYSVTGSAGQTSGGSLNHPAHYISLNNLGSLVLDVNGTTLNATFLRETGAVNDSFTLIKQGAADSDGDGLTDEFEIANGLNRNSSSDATTDSDGDGISNLVEFAFGTNPNSSDPGKLVVSNGTIISRGQPDVSITSTATSVDFRADFCRRKDQSTAGITYTVQFSSDLTTWQSSTVTPTVIADDGIYEVVTVKYPFFINGQKARFFRVTVTPN